MSAVSEADHVMPALREWVETQLQLKQAREKQQAITAYVTELTTKNDAAQRAIRAAAGVTGPTTRKFYSVDGNVVEVTQTSVNLLQIISSAPVDKKSDDKK